MKIEIFEVNENIWYVNIWLNGCIKATGSQLVSSMIALVYSNRLLNIDYTHVNEPQTDLEKKYKCLINLPTLFLANVKVVFIRGEIKCFPVV